jgi:N-acetylneuraminate synthase
VISIQDRVIGQGEPPYVIAEMSGNHNQSLKRALEIVEAAAATGVDALKLQTYTAETMTLDSAASAFVVQDEKSLWQGQSLHDLYTRAHTPWEWHEPIFRRCRELGLAVFSTPFDATALDFLESLDAPAYKIASFENTDLPLIRRVAATGKPVIISTGMATLGELDAAVSTARIAGCRELILLKCTSTYPASPAGTNLRTIPRLREIFDVEVGISDHTMGTGVSVAAVAFGATVIEKHFTLRRSDGGVDSAFSMEPEEMLLLVVEARRAQESLGEPRFGPTAQEAGSLRFRRSLYVIADMRAGDVFTAENLRTLRPAAGLEPAYYDIVLGRRVSVAVPRGTPVTWNLLR